MMRKLERLVLTSLISITIMTQPIALASAAEGASGASVVNPFKQVQGLDYEDRNKQYDTLTLSPSGWQLGMVVSKEPYAVVTKVNPEGAHVRIWTGVLARDYNDLLVFWDEIRVLPSGRLDFHATDVEETIRSYFESSSQESFRTKAYLGKFPWANIPTDAEAALSGSPKVSSEGAVNVYGIAFKDPDRAVTLTIGSVKKAEDIPDVVPTLKKFKETVVSAIPGDAASHWAKEEIVDLMKKSIIEGYEDQSIRPDRTLSKAEFVTLLVKSLGLDPSKAAAAEYADLGSHWSGPMVAAAQQFGLLDMKPVELNFAPDMPMSRMEMVELVSRILQKYKVSLKQAAISFNDTTGLTGANLSALQNVINAGIVGGYEDGSFRPKGSLTRAEAFKVVSRIIQLL